MQLKYWTCSKFADWLRGIPKPSAATVEEWNDWEKNARTKKFRYWLTEEGLDYLQHIICWPVNYINDVRCYINNRWFTKSHALNSNLQRGKWYDFDTRLLHTAFDELVNFVEIELAWMLVVFSKADRKKYKTPWYRTIFRIGLWRSPEAGIDYLKWAIALKFNEDWVDKNDPDYGQPTHQALAAEETLILYTWWKEERPKRPDPSDASGWSEYCKKNYNSDFASFNKKKAKDEYLNDILNVYSKIEKEQEDEDTDMLIRLIKLRKKLWT